MSSKFKHRSIQTDDLCPCSMTLKSIFAINMIFYVHDSYRITLYPIVGPEKYEAKIIRQKKFSVSHMVWSSIYTHKYRKKSSDIAPVFSFGSSKVPLKNHKMKFFAPQIC